MVDLGEVFRGRRVFITGHTGFKGAWLSEWLLSLGAEVHGYSIDIPTQPSLFEALDLSKRLHHRLGDINEIQPLQEALQHSQPEVVFHLAAQPLVRLSYDQPLWTFKTNILGTAHVLECLRGLSRLKAAVMVTTDKVYEPQETDIAFKEKDILGGHDPYSGSKAACELVIQSYYRSYFSKLRESVGLGVGRAGNVIGGGDFSLDRLIPDAVRAWNTQTPLVIRSPDSVRPWQHVLEPLSGYLALAGRLIENSSRFSGQAYNFGPQVESGGSVQEVTSALQKRWSGFEVQIDRSQTGDKKETQLLRLNWQKAEKELDWAPRLPLQEALDWTAEWYERFSRYPEKIREFTQSQIQTYQERLGRRNHE